MDCKKINICIIGDKCVGKTSLAELLCNYKLNKNYNPTVGVGFFCKNIYYGKDLIKINFWDTSGDERYFSLIPLYFRLSHCVLLVLDISNQKSIDNCFNWLTLVFHHKEDVIVKIFINKTDIKEDANLSKIYEYCNIKNNVSVTLISIFKNYNTTQLLNDLIKEIYPLLEINKKKIINLIDYNDTASCRLINKNCII